MYVIGMVRFVRMDNNCLNFPQAVLLQVHTLYLHTACRPGNRTSPLLLAHHHGSAVNRSGFSLALEVWVLSELALDLAASLVDPKVTASA